MYAFVAVWLASTPVYCMFLGGQSSCPTGGGEKYEGHRTRPCLSVHRQFSEFGRPWRFFQRIGVLLQKFQIGMCHDGGCETAYPGVLP